MNRDQIRAIESIKRKIDLLEKLSATIESLPELNAQTFYESCESICIGIPYDPERIRQIRSALGSDWKLRKNPNVIDSGTWFGDYEKISDPEIHLTVIAEPLDDGATCRRVKVGTRTVDVYKIVCGDELVAA